MKKLKYTIIFLLLSILLSCSAVGATVSHSSGQITPGSFQAGEYTIPDNLTIGDKLKFSATHLFEGVVNAWLVITGNTKIVGDLNVTGSVYTSANSVYVGEAKVSSSGEDLKLSKGIILDNSSSNVAGTLRWNSGNLQVYNGSDWLNINGEMSDGCTASCDAGWICVNANPSLGTTSDFCVMKYEAKNSGGTAVSTASGTPWVSITQTSAISACSAIGGHLMTKEEAQTINRDIESQTDNWQIGTVGSGCMYGGHMDNNPANALAADSDSNPYYGTGDSAGEAMKCPFDTTDGQKASRRTFTLSNGEVIWDWSGNVWEWMDETCTAGSGIGNWYNGGWIEWSDSNLGDYERAQMGPSSSSYTSSNGMGRYYGCTSSGNAFLRGGYWNGGASAGAFSLALSNAPSNSGTGLGFRCVK